MRITRRTSFASSFVVVVVGCRHPVPTPDPTVTPVHVADAGTPPDAPTADAAVRVLARASVLYWRVIGRSIEFEIPGEGHQFVPRGWRGVFVDANGQPIHGSEFRLRFVLEDSRNYLCELDQGTLPSREVQIWEPEGTLHDDEKYSPCVSGPGHRCNPPQPRGSYQPIETWVAASNRSGNTVVIELPVGAEQNVDPSWKVTFLAQDGTALEMACLIKDVRGARTICETTDGYWRRRPSRVRLSR